MATTSFRFRAPFPDATFKGGMRRFPNLVRDNPDAEGAALSRRAREWFRTEWAGRTFMAVGMKDSVPGPPVMRAMAKIIRNCPPPYEVAEGGHFLQEWGEGVAHAAMDVLQKYRARRRALRLRRPSGRRASCARVSRS